MNKLACFIYETIDISKRNVAELVDTVFATVQIYNACEGVDTTGSIWHIEILNVQN